MDSEITFRMGKHSLYPHPDIVEILVNGQVCGVIYGKEGKTVGIVSAHFVGEPTYGVMPSGIKMEKTPKLPLIPRLLVSFDPQPYHLEGHRVVRDKKKPRGASPEIFNTEIPVYWKESQENPEDCDRVLKMKKDYGPGPLSVLGVRDAQTQGAEHPQVLTIKVSAPHVESLPFNGKWFTNVPPKD